MDGRFKQIGTSVTLTVRLVSWFGVGLDGKFSQVGQMLVWMLQCQWLRDWDVALW